VKYSISVAPCLRLLQQEAECPEQSQDVHPAAVSQQLFTADVASSSVLRRSAAAAL